MTVVLAVEQQKGGVGKSDVARNLAGALRTLPGGPEVGLIDWDPQGDLSRMLKLQQDETSERRLAGGHTLAAALLGHWEPEHPGELFITHPCGVQVIPNALDMHTLEPNLYNVRAREHRLAQLVQWLAANSNLDYLLIDCPPALGLLTDNATVATDEGTPDRSGVLVVASPWPIIFGNLDLLHGQLESARAELKLRAPVVGMVVNLFDPNRGAMMIETEEKLRRRPDYLCTIRARAVIAEAQAAGTTVEQYEPASEAAGWYRSLANRLAGVPA